MIQNKKTKYTFSKRPTFWKYLNKKKMNKLYKEYVKNENTLLI